MNLHPVHHGLRRKMLAVLVAACYTSASANPTAPQVIAGQASFQQSGNLFSITNTPNAIINWQSFSIAPNEITRFIQQNADSRVLNRITGQDPSRILGALQSNGHVYLINPNGVLFGKDARIDVQGLVASSLALSDSDFLAGRHRFAGVNAGKVSNEGAIVTPNGGKVFLVGSGVDNSGVITSPQGEVVLAAGHTVQLVDSSDPSVHVVVSAPQDQALNLGQVLASGGRVGIYGALVNQRGKVSADSAVRGDNGKIVLKSSGTTLLEKGSVTSAVNTAGQGGDIRLLGQRVGLTDDAQADASGEQGGGQILIGGGQQGKDPAVPHAQQTFIGEQVQVRSNALGNGNGGRIIAWGDNATRVYGSLSARGGAQGGDGGFVEASGGYLDMRGAADTRAPRGKTGQLLLDPTNITIIGGSPSAGSDVQVSSNVFAEAGSSTDSELDTGRLVAALGNNNITVSTASSAGATGNLTVDSSVGSSFTWSSSNKLTLRADNNIAINGVISASNAPIELNAVGGSITQSSAITAASVTASAPAGSISLNHTSNAISGSVSASASGNILLAAQTLTTGTVASSGSGTIQASSASGALTIGGNMSTNGGTILLQSNYLNGIATGSSTAISSGGGVITLQGDNMDLQGTINAGAGGISATARSTSQAVHLGGTEADSTNILALTEAEIQRLSTTGAITLTNAGTTGSPDIVVNALNVASSHPSGNFNIVAQGDSDVSVQGNVSANGILVVTSGDTTTSRITLDGTLTSAASVVLSTGFLTANQNITAPTVGLVTKNSIDVGATSETAGVLNIPTASLSRFNTTSLLLQVDNSITTGDITFSQPFSWTGSLFLNAKDQYVTGSNAFSVTGQLALENGQWIQNSATLPSLSVARLKLTSAGFTRALGGDGSSASPYQITDVYGLQGVGSISASDHYIVANDIDASSTSTWNSSSGFAPLGSSTAYAGIFDGNNKTISGLTISRATTDGVGLFGYLGAGTVKNLTLSGGSITGKDMTGAVVGQVTSGSGLISGVASSAAVSGVFAVGGLAGMSSGTVSGSSSSGTVAASGSSGLAKGGGLVGYNSGAITKSFATGAVSSTVEVVGGLAGYNSGTITKSYATGSVSGGRSVGGVVGYNTASVSDTYATGSVTGTTGGGVTNAQVGGIAGYSSGGAIATSFTTSTISASGFSDVHGAIGLNASATSTNNYWNTSTAGSGVTETLATGLTSAQMQQQGSFSGFDFSNTWQLGTTNPVLRDFLVPLTVTLTGGTTSKTYDGTAQSFNPTVSYSGFTGGDTSSSLGGTLGWGTSGALHAGTYTPSGLSSNKYSITYTGASSSLTIAQRPVTAVFTGSKVYDGTTSLASPTYNISNVITADTSNLSLTGTASFADKNVGTSKPLTLSVSLSGSAAADYTLSSTSGTGTITAAPLTISGLSGVSRVYDGGVNATLNTGSATLCCKATGDTVTVSYTPGFTTFANKNVGTGKVITIGSAAFTLGGSDAGNYTMTPPTGITADITPAALTVSGLSGVSRVYDATTTAGVTGTPALSGKLGSDVVSVASYSDGTFADKNVGTGKGITLPSSAFTLTGADAGNYSVTAPTGLTANITAAPLTVSGVTAVSRSYDATTVAGLTGTPVLSGIFTVASVTDDVSASPTLGNGSFADKAVGTGKAVTAPGSVITLTGADAGNYTVSALSGLTADISKAPLTVSGLTASNRAYNQLTSASTSGGSLVGLFGSDVVALGSVTADFDTKDVGTGKTVTVSNVAISGTDAGNYSVTMPTGLSANITPAILTVSGMTADSRVYDATTVASTTGGALAGILGSEDVALGTATASFADKNVGTGKPVTVSAIALTGADAGNYTVTPPTGLTAAITAASLTVTGITGVSRAYNGGTSVNLSGSPLLAGVLGSDTVTLNASLGTGTFADKNIGTAKAITIPGGALSITGTDAANYTLIIPTGVTADVTAAGLTVTGLSATSRTYNGGTSVATTGGSLAGVIEGEVVGIGTVTADFADKNVGAAKPVTVSQVALTGADAGNYTVTAPSGLSANVTAAPLTVSGIAGLTRVYDGTASANTSGGTLSGIFGADSVAIGAVSASFADKHVGTLKPVTVASVSLTGADATNYTVTAPTGLTAAITPATLTITGITGVSKEYNNSTAATTTGGTLAGVIGGDVVAAGTFTAAYADKHVGTAKPLTLTTIALLGADAANYTLTQPTGITADITQRPLSTWVGGTDTSWTTSSNWAGGIAPDAANVAAAVLPLASGDVVLPNGLTVTLQTLTASGGQKVVVDGATLTLGTSSGHASSIAAMGINSGGVNVVGTLTGSDYVQAGGALGGSGSVTFSSFAQGGGSVSGLASLTVTNNWAQSGGTFAIPGALSIQQNTGSLVMKATTAQSSITLDVTEGGSISQNGPLVTNALSTNSQTGVTLTNTGNQIKAYSGTNSSSGGISLVNTTGGNVLALGPVTSTNGGITVDNTGSGGIHVSGALSAPTGAISLTAHSPINVTSSITADSIALDASTNVSLGSGSSLSAVHNITIDAGTGIGLDGSISSTSGSVAMVADTGNIVASSSASINSPGGVSLTTVTGSVSAANTIFVGGTTPTINDAAAVAAAKAAAEEAAAKAAAEAAAKKAAEEAAAKAAAEAAAKKAAEEAAAKAAAEAAAKKAAEEAAAKAAAEAAAKKAAEEAAAKAAAEAAAKKAAEEAAAKAAAEAAAKKAAEEAAAKAAAEAAAKAAEEAAAKAAAEAAAKAAEEAAAKAAAEAAAKAAEEAAAKAAAEAAAKAAQEAAAKAAAEAAAKKAAEEAAAKAAAAAAAKKAAEEAAAKAAAEAAAKAQQTKEAEPVREAINTAVNLINTAASKVVDTTPAVTPADTGTGAGGGSSSSASSSSSSDSKPDSDSKKEEKKDGVAPQDSAPKKDEPVKKMYCN